MQSVNFEHAIGERYISYAMATIMSRSLPDVRDGLKPVHRRLLYAMLKLHLDPNSGFKKCARVVGDVIGKYHPHGDVAVYDTLVRLAQNFAVRYPLVEGQGNFGSLDGDNAAAMRYTEAKLTDIAMLLLEDIDKNTVDFKNTYDDSDIEPCLLPAKFPNLLANGSEGIAVGMATSIPPHNIIELFSALIHLLKTPNCSIETLANFIKAPDFPTGGQIMESAASILKSYQTGKGSFRIRAKWEKEALEKGNYQIIITEIPYQVQKSRLIEKIADLYKAKKLLLVGGIRDESDSKVRIIIEPKSRNVEAELIMEQLFKLTELENKFHLNLNVLDSKLKPRVLNVKEVLEEFVAYRFLIQKRKSQFELDKIENRLEILAALLVTFLNLDRVIEIIRESDEPKIELTKEFNLNEVQVESILNTKLRSLRKLEEMKIQQEQAELNNKRNFLKSLLASESLQRDELLKDFKGLKETLAKNPLNKRRSEIINDFETSNFDETAFIENEPVTIILSKLGWIKALNNHKLDLSKQKYKAGDKEKFTLECRSTDKILLSCDDGKFYCLDSHKLPRGRTDGQAINLILDIPSQAKINNIFIYQEQDSYLLGTKFGKGFKIIAKDLFSQTKNGKQIVNLDPKDKLQIISKIAKNHDIVASCNSNKKLLMFSLEDLPEMAKGKGVILQKQLSSELTHLFSLNSTEGLIWQTGSKTRTETEIRGWLGKRATIGKMAPFGFK